MTPVKTTTKAPGKVTVKKDRYVEAIGRRKTSIARVRVTPRASGKGIEVTVNDKKFEVYFTLPKHRALVTAPFDALSISGYEVSVKADGGGVNGQAEATRLGIARALIILDVSWRPRLKVLGFLKRDPRAVERKHPGLRKARRPQQWRKR